jgi:hypothetical protein
VKLSGWLRQEKSFDIKYRTLVRYLHQHHYARRIPRPIPEPPDADQWALKRETCAARLATLLGDPSARVFFGDEAGFEGDPRPAIAGSNAAAVPPKAIMAATSGETS